mmetsp:Transcript_120179/g.345461  ORF Transcript_120179/g.345461 Transcript_120179/m.345461 type:complete len:245 (-) Transcript_120179:29-763(-)
MFFHPALWAPRGPPPQRVIDNRVYWHVLVALLTVTSVLRMATLDVIGGLLSALMLCMACAMVADGMQELARYALVFGMLSLLCLFFDTVPLLASIGGRVDVSVQPLKRSVAHSIVRTTYITTVRASPFFDSSQGWMYNLSSAAMIISPITMLLGASLAFHAHLELHRYASPFLRHANVLSWFDEEVMSGDHDSMIGATETAGGLVRGRRSARAGSPPNGGPSAWSGAPEPLTTFQGASHRLEAA